MARYRLFLGGCFGAYIVIGCMMTAIGPTLPSVRASFDVSLSALGLLFVVQAGGFLLATLLAGIGADRGLGRPLMLAGALLFAGGLAGFGVTGHWVVGLVCLFASGLGAGGLEGTMNPLTMYVEPQRRGYLVNVLHVFPCIGAILGAFTAYGVMSLWGWQMVYLLLAALTMVLVPVFLVARFPRVENTGDLQAGVDEEGTAPVVVPPLLTSLGVWRHPLALLLAGTMWVYVAVEMGLTGWAYTYVVEGLGFLPAVGTTGLAGFWIGLLLGRLAMARLSINGDNLSLIMWSGLLGCLGVLGILLWAHPAASVGALFVAGLGAAGIFPLLLVEAGDRFPGMVGSVSGLIIAAAGAGGMTGPGIMGVLADYWGMPAVMVVALVLFLTISLLAGGTHVALTRRRSVAVPR